MTLCGPMPASQASKMAGVGIGDEIAGVGIDEKELLLHPEGYLQIFSILGIAHDVLLAGGTFIHSPSAHKRWF